jgi:hypothetical protein
MIRKSGHRFFLATNAERVCAEIMLKQEGLKRFSSEGDTDSREGTASKLKGQNMIRVPAFLPPAS